MSGSISGTHLPRVTYGRTIASAPQPSLWGRGQQEERTLLVQEGGKLAGHEASPGSLQGKKILLIPFRGATLGHAGAASLCTFFRWQERWLRWPQTKGQKGVERRQAPGVSDQGPVLTRPPKGSVGDPEVLSAQLPQTKPF